MAYTADSPSCLIDEKGRRIWNEDRYHICYDDGQYEYWFGVESNPSKLQFMVRILELWRVMDLKLKWLWNNENGFLMRWLRDCLKLRSSQSTGLYCLFVNSLNIVVEKLNK